MNVTLKAPSSVAPGSTFFDRDGGSHTITGQGTLVIDSGYQIDALRAGYQPSSSFGAPTANVTANSGGGQANATALAYGINQIATVAAAADSALLPAALPGLSVTVINDGANPAQIFGSGADTINGVANSTGVSQPANSVQTYDCVVAGQWRVVPQQGFQGASPTWGSTANNVSSNGASLANGTGIAADITRVTTVAAANGALRLPAALPGMRKVVTNANGGNTANIFPAVNESINSGAANASVQLAANKSAMFTCAVAGTWDVIASA